MKLGPPQKHDIMLPLNNILLGYRVTFINDNLVFYDTVKTIKIHIKEFMNSFIEIDIEIESLISRQLW